MTKRYSTASLTTASLALLLGSAIAFTPVISADAAPRPREASAATARAKVADAGNVPATTGSVTPSAAEEEPTCSRPRRRLWVEGEGWVVRRIAVCR